MLSLYCHCTALCTVTVLSLYCHCTVTVLSLYCNLLLLTVTSPSLSCSHHRLRPLAMTYIIVLYSIIYLRFSGKFPKLLVTSRSELFTQFKDYIGYFVPVETQNKQKDTDHKAVGYLTERRLLHSTNPELIYLISLYHIWNYSKIYRIVSDRFAPFQDKRVDYQLQYIALKWRDMFQQKFKNSSAAKPLRVGESYEKFLELIGHSSAKGSGSGSGTVSADKGIIDHLDRQLFEAYLV